jgi:hypothetical protein
MLADPDLFQRRGLDAAQFKFIESEMLFVEML